MSKWRTQDASEFRVIGVVVPAHDEEETIGACLHSVAQAARCRELRGEQVAVVVVLDACSDATATIARDMGALVVAVNAHNVGVARAAGASLALDIGVRWLAFTDADSVVACNWLAAQLALGSDAVCGTVAVQNWESYGGHMQRHYESSYTDADGHHHIHGANLGVSAEAYRLAGGFEPLESSEDVALVKALEANGARIAWSAAPRVVTSARRSYRAPAGFGATLERIDTEAAALTTSRASRTPSPAPSSTTSCTTPPARTEVRAARDSRAR